MIEIYMCKWHEMASVRDLVVVSDANSFVRMEHLMYVLQFLKYVMYLH